MAEYPDDSLYSDNPKGPFAVEPFYMTLMQLLIHNYFCITADRGIVVDQTTVLNSAGYAAANEKITAIKLLENFEQVIGIKLNLKEYDYFDGKARTAFPEFTSDIIKAIAAENKLSLKDAVKLYGKDNMVLFITGEVSSCKAHKALLKQYRAELTMNEEHPTFALWSFLNNQDQAYNRAIIKQNKESTIALIATLKPVTMEYSNAVIKDFDYEGNTLYYTPAVNSTRIYPNSGHQWSPAKVRKTAYASTKDYTSIELDLVCSQLAIFAYLTESKVLKDILTECHNERMARLGTGVFQNPFMKPCRSIWVRMCEEIGLDPKFYKALVKAPIYPAIYGSSIRNAKNGKKDCRDIFKDHELIADRPEKERQELWMRYSKSALFIEIVKRREDWFDMIESGDGKATDAFERELEVNKDNHANAIACQVAQSYETKIMLTLLPIFKKYEKICFVSFLHDGCNLIFRNKDSSKKTRHEMFEELNQAASENGYGKLGILTDLEFNSL